MFRVRGFVSGNQEQDTHALFTWKAPRTVHLELYLKVQGLGLGVLEFRVYGLRVQGLGFGVYEGLVGV